MFLYIYTNQDTYTRLLIAVLFIIIDDIASQGKDYPWRGIVTGKGQNRGSGI